MSARTDVLRERVAALESRVADLRSPQLGKRDKDSNTPGSALVALIACDAEGPAGSVACEEKQATWRHKLPSEHALSSSLPSSGGKASHLADALHSPAMVLTLRGAAAPMPPSKGRPLSPPSRLSGHPVRLPGRPGSGAPPPPCTQKVASMAAELETMRRMSAALEERLQVAEHEATLLRADKACMVRALNYTQRDNDGLHLEAEEVVQVVQAVRGENAELLEMVEEQHTLLAQQQARASKAEREVHRLRDETLIMREALKAADENVDELLQRVEYAESQLVLLRSGLEEDHPLAASPRVSAAAQRLYHQASLKAEEVSQAAAALDSLAAKPKEAAVGEESQLVKKQQELLQQQQDLLLVLLQRGEAAGSWSVKRRTWLLLASFTAAAALASVATAIALAQRRRL